MDFPVFTQFLGICHNLLINTIAIGMREKFKPEKENTCHQQGQSKDSNVFFAFFALCRQYLIHEQD